MVNQPNVAAVMGEVVFCVKTAEPKALYAAPAAAAAAAATNDDEEEEAKPAARVKNAMDLLPPAKLNLEEWKRFYSNCKETNPVACNWFWERYEPEAYTIWRADYLYNDELQKIFMTCNLVTGLFARMDNMRRYAFGVVLIFGQDDANEVSGYFVIRGTEMPELMKEVPDFESYKWTQMDVNDAAQVKLFNEYLAWEGDLDGKTVNQGKAFK